MRRRALLAAAALSACGRSPEPRVFTLIPVDGPTVARAPRTVAVRSIGLARYLDRPQIVRTGGGVEVAVSDIERWAEPLADMIARVLIENLSRRLPGARVFLESGPVSVAPDATVELEVTRFDPDAAGIVRFSGQAAIRRTGGRVTGPQAVEASATPAGPETTELVRAMSVALGRASDQVAALIARG